jgi:acyl-CoA reductase-like NAD-dependent aldehyde dehydrogenase
MKTMYEQEQLFIGGEWVDPAGDARLEVVCPSSEELIGWVPLPTAADVDRAVAAARRAFDEGPWPRMSLAERSAVVARAAEILQGQVADIARMMTAEMGSPITVTSTGHVPLGVQMLHEFIEIAAGLNYEEFRATPRGPALIWREPVGVVGAIAPWNGPFIISIAKVIPALLVGCTVVFKPAPETPLDVAYLAQALADAGLPEGVLNVVPADRDVSPLLVEHPGVDMVSFTGSTAVGRHIGTVCGEQIKRVHLELGGKSAAIIMPDADLEVTMPALQNGAFRNSGQVCAALTRVLAPRRLYDEVVGRLCDRARDIVVGDPFDPSTQMGPLVSQRQRDRVERYISLGSDAGAKVMTGGGRPAGLSRGWYVEPTVFAQADNSMQVAREEVFGPVVVVIPYGDDDDPISIANDSPYGLHGAVFTSDPERALAVARRVRTGTFSINGHVVNSAAPFGGMKCSGTPGREFGPEGFEGYLEPRTINVPAGWGAAGAVG